MQKNFFIKYSSVWLCVVSVAVFFAFFDKSKISANILDLFPKVEQRELIDIHLELASQNELLIALPESKKNSADSAIKTKNPSTIAKNTPPQTPPARGGASNSSIAEAKSKTSPFFAEVESQTSPSLAEGARGWVDSAPNAKDSAILTKLKSIDKITQITHLKDNIYNINFTKDTSTADFYDEFKTATKDIKGLRYFSSDILRIENDSGIFSDISVITASSVVFLILLYLFILRIPFLSLNTLLTIASANLLGITALTQIYENVNIMALEFGVAIGNLAIDYMLHHHFFRHYMHKFAFNKSVFYGFITSFIGFFICLFIPFPLLAQLSLYAMICLLVSYLSFGLLYQFIGFKKPIFYRKIRRFRRPKVSSKIIAVIAVIALAVSAFNMELDYDLERLDYQNKARLADKDYFKNVLGESVEILIISDSRESLPQKAMQVAQKAQIKSDIRNLAVVEHNGKFYSAISVEGVDSLQNLDFVETRSIETLSNEITSGIYKPMLLILAIVISSMIAIVLLITRSLTSLVYIIAPLAAIFVYFLGIKVNIMHLFSLLIVVVSSIDYGIYVKNEGENIKTLHAIIFSALTTIAGFGFLSFSKILALQSFGITIIIGLGVILLLLLFQRRKAFTKSN
ncbi:hypothetical protein [Helicobacter sp. 23-1045]